MDKWEDFDQIEADRLLAEQMQAQMTSSESEESGRSGQTSKIILCINVPKFLTKKSQFFLSTYVLGVTVLIEGLGEKLSAAFTNLKILDRITIWVF